MEAAGVTAGETDRNRRKLRAASIVIAVAMIAWIGASWLGGALGLPGRYAILLDLTALAAFLWAIIVVVQVWRARDRSGR